MKKLLLALFILSSCHKKDICLRCSKQGESDIVVCGEDVSVQAYLLTNDAWVCHKK